MEVQTATDQVCHEMRKRRAWKLIPACAFILKLLLFGCLFVFVFFFGYWKRFKLTFIWYWQFLYKRNIHNTHFFEKQSHISNNEIKAGVGFDSCRSKTIDSLQSQSQRTALGSPGEMWMQAGWCTDLLTASGALYAGRAFLPLWNELGEHETWAALQQSIMYEELGGSCWILPRWHQTVQPSGNAGRSLKTHYLWSCFDMKAQHREKLVYWNMCKPTRFSIVVTQEVYWGSRGLKASL